MSIALALSITIGWIILMAIGRDTGRDAGVTSAEQPMQRGPGKNSGSPEIEDDAEKVIPFRVSEQHLDRLAARLAVRLSAIADRGE